MKQIAAKHRRAPALDGVTSRRQRRATTATPRRRVRRRVRDRCGRAAASIAAIDIGTTKICCFIARVENEPRILGIGQQIARGVRGGTIIDLEAAGASISGAVHAAEQMAGADDRPRRRQPVGRLSRLAHRQDRDRRRPARDRRRRHAPGARARLCDARRAGSPGHPLDPGRLLDRRQPRHPRSARHGRRAARRQHAHRDRRDRQRAQPHRGARTRASRSRGAGRQPLRRGPRLPRRGREGSRRHGRRHGRRHDDDRRVLRRQSDLRRCGPGRRHARDARHRARPVDAAGACRAA